MNHTMKRRLAAMLAVPALLFTAAACGSDDGNNGDTSGGVAEVSGKAGAKPEITIPKDTDPSEKTVVKTVTPGSGTAIKDSDFVRLDWTVEKWGDDQQLGGTWTDAATGDTPRRQAVEQIGKPSQQLPEKVLDAVKGKKPGSRILVQGTAGDLIGENLNTASGISADDVLIWVVDPVGGTAVDAKAEVKGEQAPPAAGMPEVEAKPQQAATITIPKGVKAPTTLKEQVLIKGDGKKVEAGQGLIAQYTGVKWEDGKKFDSSWDHGGATAFQIGTGSVVEGWDKGLVGKNVGDRVLLVIPPALGYGANPSSELAKNTLVFVVDILGTV
ncbi:FKBP-type peptidyl-prolyl cis-trans isomerase [Streptomyces antibioticus]|uniref:peptidylprolyl isomerase n=1 Tax=Streptomyces antibioticus TaxID=1890 RepID=A0AAE6Y630_STRAT|nr:FKBP-type peptidyl-prolyl cis-trans isomerase [Streptomyces antibioticus]MCX5168008.1 FKBP-type peptidyl-prolyl cis-trans isomerase [Streptomyces antibioticus]QIT43561.1 FKBP-type peptidyl-prolyl cis-trans isomerase [Streptomyces antibioticus]